MLLPGSSSPQAHYHIHRKTTTMNGLKNKNSIQHVTTHKRWKQKFRPVRARFLVHACVLKSVPSSSLSVRVEGGVMVALLPCRLLYYRMVDSFNFNGGARRTWKTFANGQRAGPASHVPVFKWFCTVGLVKIYSIRTSTTYHRVRGIAIPMLYAHVVQFLFWAIHIYIYVLLFDKS
jgi:hypothetical protein